MGMKQHQLAAWIEKTGKRVEICALGEKFVFGPDGIQQDGHNCYRQLGPLNGERVLPYGLDEVAVQDILNQADFVEVLESAYRRTCYWPDQYEALLRSG